MHPIAPPPQSYSRLYRPWVDQDGTVSSTTHAADTSEEDDDPEEEMSRMEHDEHDCSTSDSMDRSCPDQMPPTNQPQHRQHRHHHDRLPSAQADANFYTTQPHALSTMSPGPNLTPAMFAIGTASPFAYSPAAPGYLLANEMEQAYHRVLAEEQRTKQLSSRKQRPKRFVCPHCDVAFSNNGQLQGHIRIHTGERPFRCDAEQCGKTFTRNEELTRHKRIHTGVRPYACDQCGKRFGRRDHLKKHARTHMVVVGQHHHHHHHGHHPMPMHPYDMATTSAAAAAAAVAAAMMPMYPYMFG